MKFLDDAKQQVKDTVDEMTDETKGKVKHYGAIGIAFGVGLAVGCAVMGYKNVGRELDFYKQLTIAMYKD